MKASNMLLKTFLYTSVGLIVAVQLLGQNCKAYLYYGDTCSYDACRIAAKRAGYYQYASGYHKALDKAIDECDAYAPAYRHKSVAYLKSGDFINWEKLIDKAVALDPLDNLGYRGWCRYQFFRDYRGAIQDIERLDALIDYDISTSAGGEYHLHVARALCYKALDETEKAIEVLEEQLVQKDYSIGMSDYLHLGVLYLEADQLDLALEAFQKQATLNNLAEVQYYSGQLYIKLNDMEQAQSHLETALRLYNKGDRMYDPYTHQMDKIYREQIVDALSSI